MRPSGDTLSPEGTFLRQSSRESPTGAGFRSCRRTVPCSACRTSRSTARPPAEALGFRSCRRSARCFGRRTSRSRCRAPQPVPPSRARSRCRTTPGWRTASGAHAVKPLHVDTAAHGVCHPHAHEPHGRSRAVGGCHAHGVCLRRGKVCRRHRGIAHDGRLLQLLDHGLVLGGGNDGVHAKGRHLYAAHLPPGLGELLVQRLRQLLGVRGHRRVPHTHCRDARKCRLQCREQLALELRVYFVSRVGLLDVAAHVLVEHERVDNPVRVLAVAAHGDVHVQSNVVVDHAEGHRRRRPVLVAHNLLGVEEVDALVLARVTAKREARPHALEGRPYPLAQRAALAKEEARFR